MVSFGNSRRSSGKLQKKMEVVDEMH